MREVLLDLTNIKYFFFDLDGTIVDPKEDTDLIATPSNIKLIDGVKRLIHFIDEQMYGTVSIITNQQGVFEGFTDIREVDEKISIVLKMLEPTKIYAVASSGYGNDYAPKPDTEMFDSFHDIYDDLSINNSVYIGDAGFDENDHERYRGIDNYPVSHSNTDRLFAQNCKVPYIHITHLLSAFKKKKGNTISVNAVLND